jgi:hypothetical protein
MLHRYFDDVNDANIHTALIMFKVPWLLADRGEIAVTQRFFGAFLQEDNSFRNVYDLSVVREEVLRAFNLNYAVRPKGAGYQWGKDPLK